MKEEMDTVKGPVRGMHKQGKYMWRDTQITFNLCDPIVMILRMGDSDEPTAGQVWQAMANLLKHGQTAILGRKEKEHNSAEKSCTS